MKTAFSFTSARELGAFGAGHVGERVLRVTGNEEIIGHDCAGPAGGVQFFLNGNVAVARGNDLLLGHARLPLAGLHTSSGQQRQGGDEHEELHTPKVVRAARWVKFAGLERGRAGWVERATAEAGMQGAEKRGSGPLSSDELEQDREESGTTLRQGDSAGHTVPESERDPTEADSGQARTGTLSGTILPPD